MTKKRFQITYRDPDTLEKVKVEREFDHTEEFPAKMWAEDLAYTLADKGWYEVKEMVVS
jgi:hypothetical protein